MGDQSRSVEGGTRQRASFLLNGRRVTVRDLVGAGLLKVGTRLTFKRPRIGDTHVAWVTGDSRIQLSDGRLYRSPSSAARSAVGAGSYDGWHAWALDDGTTLNGLRQQLLDGVAVEISSEDMEAWFARRRHEALRNAREEAERGAPRTVRVGEFRSWWHYRDVDHSWSSPDTWMPTDERIENDLENHGLSTVPDFRAVRDDFQVSLVVVPQEEEDAPGAGQAEPRGSVAPAGEENQVGVRSLAVGQLRSAFSGVAALAPSATFHEAITRMRLDDYSQLAVVVGKHHLRGAVTWESIASAWHQNPEAPFSDAIVGAREVPYDRHLVDVIPQLHESGFVFVRNEKNEVAGIVTAADVAEVYGVMATPFLLFGELDRRLRRIIEREFDISYVAGICESADRHRTIGSVHDLSMGDYQRVLENKEAWEALGWPLNRKVFVQRLGELRAIRNDVMHFNQDLVPERTVEKIRRMIETLRRYGD